MDQFDITKVPLACGLLLDLTEIEALVEQIRDIPAEKHVDVLVVFGGNQYEFTLVEFLTALGIADEKPTI